MSRKYILAEYCSADFFTGWWLYERDHNDGSPNRSISVWHRWGRLEATDKWSPQANVYELCVQMGHTPPEPKRHEDGFAEWFARTFPAGLLVDADAGPNEYPSGPYHLVEIVSGMPRQRRRGAIRTINGARRADQRRRKGAISP